MNTTRVITSPSHPSYTLPVGVRPLAIDGEPWPEQLSTASVLPEQFFNPPPNFFTGRPVAALLRAVLEDALKCFQSQYVTEGGHLRQEAHEAKAWFWSEEERWPFSFRTVCTILGLEPEAVRQQLKRWSLSHPIASQKKLRRITPRY